MTRFATLSLQATAAAITVLLAFGLGGSEVAAVAAAADCKLDYTDCCGAQELEQDTVTGLGNH